jgi:hypothetical protein
VARAPADGYTILVVSTGFMVNPSMYAKVPYGRVEMWRGGGRLNISVCRLFRLAVP